MSGVKVRPLSASEIKGLGSLFETERESISLYYWDDRGPDFLRVYESFRPGERRYRGAFIENQLVAMTGLIPNQVLGLDKDQPVTMVSDMFVVPKYRRTKIATEILRERFVLDAKDFSQGVPFFFGVENAPGLLDGCASLALAANIHFQFVANTRLSQIFLTEAPQIHQPIEVKKTTLGLVPEAILTQWLEQLKSNWFLYPRVEIDDWQRLAVAEPDGEALWLEKNGHLQAAAVLLTQTNGRRYILTGRNSVVLERLRRERGERLGQGDEFRLGVVGLTTETIPGGPLKNKLFAEVASRARQRNLHFLAFRDESDLSLSGLKGDREDHSRRVFIVFDKSHARDAFIRSQILKGETPVKMESIYL